MSELDTYFHGMAVGVAAVRKIAERHAPQGQYETFNDHGFWKDLIELEETMGAYKR